MQKPKPKIGLVLSGGGARAAYQVGVLKAICEFLPKDSSNPFPIICGTSAGAINSAALAIYGANFHEAVKRLLRVWHNFRTEKVFRADAVGIVKSGAHWLAALFVGGLGRYNPTSLLDRAPLRKLLNNYMPCEQIQQSIENGTIDALGITASGYASGQSVTFFQAKEGIESWRRVRRVGSCSDITVDHLMASSAIPFIFPAEKLHREYFGDGSMRQTAPLSPALHLGAERVLVIGVTNDNDRQEERIANPGHPSLAQIASHILNSIFLDAMEADIERLERINKTVGLIPSHHLEESGTTLRAVEALVIAPSEDLQSIAARHTFRMPRAIRYLLRGIGAFNKSGASLVSYLLFEKFYIRELISLGYADTMQRKHELIKFMELEQ